MTDLLDLVLKTLRKESAPATPLIYALALIVRARDNAAEGEPSFLKPDQSFDDWAADIAENALREYVRRKEEE